MRRLDFIHHFRQWLAIGIACFALLLCGIVFTEHGQAGTGSESMSCSAACHNHSSPVGGQAGNLFKQEDDDKEPTPPVAYWAQFATPLYAIVLPVFALVLYRPRAPIFLLEQKLRF